MATAGASEPVRPGSEARDRLERALALLGDGRGSEAERELIAALRRIRLDRAAPGADPGDVGEPTGPVSTASFRLPDVAASTASIQIASFEHAAHAPRALARGGLATPASTVAPASVPSDGRDAEPPLDLAPPGYGLEARLGAGPVGVVFRARFPSSRAAVAAKRLDLSVAADARQRRAWLAAILTEVEAVRELDHPGVARVLAVATDERGATWVVQELLEPPPHPLASGGAMVDRAQWLQVARELALALAALHAQGVVHGAVTPRNVLARPGSQRLVFTDAGQGDGAWRVPARRVRASDRDAAYSGAPGDVLALGRMLEGCLPALIDTPVVALLRDMADPEPARRPTAAAVAARCTSLLGAAGTERYDVTPEELAVPSPPGYRLEELLGKGGNGEVYSARHLALDRRVAIKLLFPGHDATALARFRTEVRTLARLKHPAIVAVHEIGEHEGRLWFAMERIDGRPLSALIQARELTPARTLRLVEQVLEAIAHAHGVGIIHRDLKPSNVLVGADDRAHVVDFGLARDQHLGHELTRTGQVLGTPAYMSPEQARADHRSVGEASDLYSIGAILYEALSGRPPFRARSILVLLQYVAAVDPVPLARIAPGVHRDLAVVVEKAMSKRPANRYPSALAMLADLRRVQKGEPILARPPGPLARALRLAVRHRAALVGAIAAAVVLVALVWAVVLPWHYVARSLENARGLEDLGDPVAATAVYSQGLAELGSPVLRVVSLSFRGQRHPHERAMREGVWRSRLAAARKFDRLGSYDAAGEYYEQAYQAAAWLDERGFLPPGALAEMCNEIFLFHGAHGRSLGAFLLAVERLRLSGSRDTDAFQDAVARVFEDPGETARARMLAFYLADQVWEPDLAPLIERLAPQSVAITRRLVGQLGDPKSGRLELFGLLRRIACQAAGRSDGAAALSGLAELATELAAEGRDVCASAVLAIVCEAGDLPIAVDPMFTPLTEDQRREAVAVNRERLAWVCGFIAYLGRLGGPAERLRERVRVAADLGPAQDLALQAWLTDRTGYQWTGERATGGWAGERVAAMARAAGLGSSARESWVAGWARWWSLHGALSPRSWLAVALGVEADAELVSLRARFLAETDPQRRTWFHHLMSLCGAAGARPVWTSGSRRTGTTLEPAYLATSWARATPSVPVPTVAIAVLRMADGAPVEIWHAQREALRAGETKTIKVESDRLERGVPDVPLRLSAPGVPVSSPLERPWRMSLKLRVDWGSGGPWLHVGEIEWPDQGDDKPGWRRCRLDKVMGFGRDVAHAPAARRLDEPLAETFVLLVAADAACELTDAHAWRARCARALSELAALSRPVPDNVPIRPGDARYDALLSLFHHRDSLLELPAVGTWLDLPVPTRDWDELERAYDALDRGRWDPRLGRPRDAPSRHDTLLPARLLAGDPSIFARSRLAERVAAVASADGRDPWRFWARVASVSSDATVRALAVRVLEQAALDVHAATDLEAIEHTRPGMLGSTLDARVLGARWRAWRGLSSARLGIALAVLLVVLGLGALAFWPGRGDGRLPAATWLVVVGVIALSTHLDLAGVDLLPTWAGAACGCAGALVLARAGTEGGTRRARARWVVPGAFGVATIAELGAGLGIAGHGAAVETGALAVGVALLALPALTFALEPARRWHRTDAVLIGLFVLAYGVPWAARHLAAVGVVAIDPGGPVELAVDLALLFAILPAAGVVAELVAAAQRRARPPLDMT